MSVRKQQAAQTELELKAAAVRVFARTGYLKAKITDITAEAGRATGSFYKHFTGKESVLEALLADLLTRTDDNLRALEHGHPDDFRDREAVRWHVASFWDFQQQHRTVLVALQQASTVDAAFARRQDEMLEPDLRHLAEHLSGLALPGDPIVAATIVSRLMWSFATATPPHTSDDEAIETLTTFIHAGLAGLGRS
ncbi:TetR/AcrR family transcriptional regulator [Kineosporia sp. NBRC 101731]|uniref:TetR/AcrR family transcriptional regulator n=1 Tax=Kineosporia sp. NBRC 101731 TaxID=3032199 RepID=UPI0024A481CB|nr:TetR/AcrR family transcriptional regulator [Kineosporia sp. NBRC 101731]GLY28778.1 TetR family transcriptional regulator [Kineosporia sp. NBRC 101731]